MTEYTAAQIQAEADNLIAAVDRFAEVVGMQIDGLQSIDIAVVVGQRGFDENGGLSRAVVLVPTDSAQYTLIGLLREAQLEYDRRSWNANGDED